jgi:beta-xylosidase
LREAALDVNSCGVDEFTGTALDTTRWNEIVRQNTAGYRVDGGQLKLRALKGDMYGDRATAQNVILQDAPSGAWTATAKLDSKAFTQEGQQAGLIVRKDDRTFSKFVVINKGAQGRWFEHVFTLDQQPRRVIGTDTTAPLPDTCPAAVYIRVISDGETIRGEYSGDGITFAPIGRPAKIGSGVKVGMYAADNAADGPEIPFESVSLNAQSDEFAGDALEKCRWSHITREDATGYRVADGALEIDTGPGEVDGTAPNLIGQPVPAGAWEVETKIDVTTLLNGQQAGLLLYKDNRNWIKAVLVDKGATSQIEFVRVKDGGYQLDAPFNVQVPSTLTSFYLRMRSTGATASAQYSTDGTTWTEIGKSRDISDLSGAFLGPVALRGGAASAVKARFDYVRVRPSPVAACTPPGAPETGFERLWNGVDLAGTTQAGPGGFDIVNDGAEGCRLVSRGGLGLLWFNQKSYDNFVLRAQFRTADDTDNSGIFVRFPNPGTDANIPIAQGHEIQIREGVAGDGEDQKTGSVYNFDREDARAAKPAGEWNDYEIRYEAGKYTITFNGTVVNEWTNDLRQGKNAGFIGLQNHSTADEVSFRNVRVQALAGPANLFTTIGITRSETRQNSQIYGNPTPYSLPAEEMPPSGTVGVPPADATDDVPLRMPDTSGTKANLAAFRGQTLTLRDQDQKAYTKLHFFGTTTDGGPAGGDFILNYKDGTQATIPEVRFPDWCGSGNASAHFAIGPLSQRYRTTGGDGARCGIYHFPATNPEPTKILKSVTLPSSTTPTSPNIQAYLMALTLEKDGAFTLPDLSGQVAFPDDVTPPVSEHELTPGEPSPTGWFTAPVQVRLDADDPDNGSGVEQIRYTIDGGTPTLYSGPVTVSDQGEHEFAYQAIDRAGNAETFKTVTIKVDPTAPETTTTVNPGLPLGGDGWYDSAVTVRLKGGDGSGSGVDATEFSLDGGQWTAYGQAIRLEQAGVHTIAYHSVDVAGNTEDDRTLTVKVDATAPTTTARINGAAPAADYSGAVRVAFTRTDGEGSGAVLTQYAIDGAKDWTDYEGAFDITAAGGHRVDFRSIDAAGNVENYKWVIFTITPARPQATMPPVPPAAPAPAPKPRPEAELEDVGRRFKTVSALRGGRVKVRVACQAVDRGKLSLKVSKATTKHLKLKSRTLVRRTVRCGDEGRGSVTLKPSSKVRRALARTRRSITATLSLRFTGAATDTQTVTFRGKS